MFGFCFFSPKQFLPNLHCLALRIFSWPGQYEEAITVSFSSLPYLSGHRKHSATPSDVSSWSPAIASNRFYGVGFGRTTGILRIIRWVWKYYWKESSQTQFSAKLPSEEAFSLLWTGYESVSSPRPFNGPYQTLSSLQLEMWELLVTRLICLYEKKKKRWQLLNRLAVCISSVNSFTCFCLYNLKKSL